MKIIGTVINKMWHDDKDRKLDSNEAEAIQRNFTRHVLTKTGKI